jgi:hypothetical protein
LKLGGFIEFHLNYRLTEELNSTTNIWYKPPLPNFIAIHSVVSGIKVAGRQILYMGMQWRRNK